MRTEIDRRRYGRIAPPYLRIYSPMPARVIDLSRRGMCLEAVGGLVPGQSWSFRLRHRGHILTLEAEIRWSTISAVLANPRGEALEISRAGSWFVGEVPQRLLDLLIDPEAGSSLEQPLDRRPRLTFDGVTIAAK